MLEMLPPEEILLNPEMLPQDSTSSPSLVHFFVLSPFLIVVTHLHPLEELELERECFDDEEL